MRFALVTVSVLDSDHDALFFLTRSFGDGHSSKATVLLFEKLLRSQRRGDLFLRGGSAEACVGM